MGNWLREALWRVFDLPPWGWIALVMLAFYLIGLADPLCCSVGPVDDYAAEHRW